MNSRMSTRWLIILLAALLAASCREHYDAGIDGTGAPVVVFAYGRVTHFGSVWVNGVRYDTSGATFTINGRPGRQDDLGIGDIVLVEGTMDPGATSGVADRVVFDHVLQGPIGSIDTGNSSLVALGQTITITADTFFDAMVPNGVDGLAAGDIINVSGFRTAGGLIVATRIGKMAPGAEEFKVIGAVTNVASDDKRFSINALTVDYSAATLLGDITGGAIADRDIIEVKGTSLGTDGELIAASVELKATAIAGNADDRVDIEGYITRVDPADLLSFHVADVPVMASAAAIDGTLTLDAAIEVEGSLDASGVVVASRVKAGPGRDLEIEIGPHTVEGVVFEPYSGVVVGASVTLTVQLPTMGYSYWWAHHPLYSDQAGRFSAPFLPNAQITIKAGKEGFVQPCAVILDTRDSVEVSVEVTSESTLNSLSPPRPQSAREPSLTGMIFEVTEAGRQPVSGARLGAAHNFETWYATTLSDLQGGYFLCNLPPMTTELWVTKPGFHDVVIRQMDTSQSTVLDIEMKRR